MAVVANPNGKARAGSGLGPRTQIVSATVADQAALDAMVAGFGVEGHTIAGIEGSVGGTMHFAIQGGATVASPVGGVAVVAVADFVEA